MIWQNLLTAGILCVVFFQNSFAASTSVYLDCNLIEIINGEIAFAIDSSNNGSAKMLAPIDSVPGTENIPFDLTYIEGREIPTALQDPAYPSTLYAPFILGTTLLFQYDWNRLNATKLGGATEPRLGLIQGEILAEKLNCRRISKDEYDKLKARY